MTGYKVFNPDWTCRGFQYEVGKTYEEDVSPAVCNVGFHFCKQAKDCFNYYRFDPNNKVAEVIAFGDVAEEGDKCSTNKIEIVREVTWEEVLTIVNTGNWNTGYRNTGNSNTGNSNSGDWNTGNSNTGNKNTKNWNSGDRNTGNRNTGNSNTGNWNTGYKNTGDRNTGNWNTGNSNTGNKNTGDWNTGYRNTGNSNTGNWNSGNSNSGDWNTGNWNSGNWNSGDWNKSSFNNGCFNTAEPKITLFNKPSDWTYRDWLNSDARYLLNRISKDVVEWIYESDMTDEEKVAHPEYETTGGYLKVLDESDYIQIWWDGLGECDKNIIKGLPNFDIEIFEQITGIKEE